MCGIAGYIGRKKIEPKILQNTLSAMKNRGPDFSDFAQITDGDLDVSLLHSRLSIIDLDVRSHQPFKIGNLTLIYNGEIYNYLEIKNDLIKKGVAFKTQSDTEVLLQAYIHYGSDFYHKLEGMWAFALYDGNIKKLILSRDRFAEKPLYYHKTSEGIFFGSEIKFLSALSQKKFTPNLQQIKRYLTYGYKSVFKKNETFFEDVFEVPFATEIIVDSSLKTSERRYWKPTYHPNPHLTLEGAIEGVREKLIRSVGLRLRSDVPLAFCLSGGVDSASIASIAAKQFNQNITTYSLIDPDERYNEEKNILSTLQDIGCKNHVIQIEQTRNLDRLKNLVSYHDSPIQTLSFYIHSFICEAVSQDSFKVSFSGIGADELLTGYYDHFIQHLHEMKSEENYEDYKVNWQEHIQKYVRNPFLRDPDFYSKNIDYREHIYLLHQEFGGAIKGFQSEPFYEDSFSNSLLRNRMMNELFYEGSRVSLHEDDLNSMMYSIENRSPFLDRELFDFSYSIPNKYLIQNGYGKYILREAMKGILNDPVRLDRQKKGFNASITSLFNLKDKEIRESILDHSSIYEWFDKSYIENLMSQNEFPNSYSKFIFYFMNSKIFLETFSNH